VLFNSVTQVVELVGMSEVCSSCWNTGMPACEARSCGMGSWTVTTCLHVAETVT
jgi:hypothetical protein